MNELALFAGAGGGILGGKLLGWRTVCAVEWEPYPASVLVARQNDGLLPPFPIWDDIQTFDGKPWRGIVDVVSGGFPCQDISSAGQGAGINGERSGMWREMARIIHEVQPRFAFVENSSMLTSRGLGTVLGDLATMGFDARWGVLGAADVGANHQRDRIWVVAKNMAYTNSGNGWTRKKSEQSERNLSGECFSNGGDYLANADSLRKLQSQRIEQNKRRRTSNSGDEMADTNSTYGKGNECAEQSITERTITFKPGWWEIEPELGRVADGVAARVDRLKAIGNGQVPLCAATAWKILSEMY